MHTIEIFIESGNWVTKHSSPDVLELFGTDIIQTPFFATKPANEVLASIKELNPDRNVFLR